MFVVYGFGLMLNLGTKYSRYVRCLVSFGVFFFKGRDSPKHLIGNTARGRKSSCHFPCSRLPLRGVESRHAQSLHLPPPCCHARGTPASTRGSMNGEQKFMNGAMSAGDILEISYEAAVARSVDSDNASMTTRSCREKNRYFATRNYNDSKSQ